jgi:hypothetical protein
MKLNEQLELLRQKQIVQRENFGLKDNGVNKQYELKMKYIKFLYGEKFKYESAINEQKIDRIKLINDFKKRSEAKK